MLSRFKIVNFRSIRELVVDMSYGEGKAPNGYQNSISHVFFEAKKKRYVPCLAFYGANATGKTNIIKAMNFFRQVALSGIRPRTFDPNRLNPPSNTTLFELEIVIQKRLLQYSIEYDGHHIEKEILLCDGESVFSIERNQCNFSKIVTKTYPIKILEDIYTTECCPSKKEQFRTFLSVIGNRLPGLNENIFSAYHFFKNDIFILENNNISLTQGIDLLAELFAHQKIDGDPVQLAFETILRGLKKLDIDIERMVLERSQDTLETLFSDEDRVMDFLRREAKVEPQNGKLIISSDVVTSWHKDINGNSVAFDFKSAESMGTQVIASLLGILYRALKNGNVVMVDELDKSLHPFLLAAIVRMFKNKNLNKNNAQLIFTTHDVFLLENQQLRVSEIGIIEKNLKRGTTVKRLCEDKEIRNVSNFKQLYLDGVYGGIPFPHW